VWKQGVAAFTFVWIALTDVAHIRGQIIAGKPYERFRLKQLLLLCIGNYLFCVIDII